MAGVLAGGRGSLLSNRPGAELWGVLKPAGGATHITVDRALRSRPGLRVHRSSVPADEVGRCRGIPVTTVVRTILDIAPTLTPARLKSVIDAAENQGFSGPLSLADLQERYPRRAGTAALRRIIAEDRVGIDVPREELELRFAEFIERFGLPRPAVNKVVEAGEAWREVDCVWESARLIVELDSRKHHDNSTAFEEDRARDQSLIGAGWRVVRITWKQLHGQPEQLARDLRRALSTLA